MGISARQVCAGYLGAPSKGAAQESGHWFESNRARHPWNPPKMTSALLEFAVAGMMLTIPLWWDGRHEGWEWMIVGVGGGAVFAFALTDLRDYFRRKAGILSDN